MIETTKKSKAIDLLLKVLRSSWRNIGIIGNLYYGYSRKGAFCFQLRRDWQSDFNFPGIPCTKKRIPTKELVTLLDDKYFQDFNT